MRWSLLWERLWPALALPATVVGVFLAASWLGLWLWMPAGGRMLGVAFFAVLLAASLLPLMQVRLPTVAEGLRRLDQESGLAHRPATAMVDTIATPQDDPWALALWQSHLARSLTAARALKAGWPSPRLALRDPTALRALVLIGCVAAFFAAQDERGRRLAAAFDWQGVAAPINFRLDAWVSPPHYTGRPPVMLSGLRPGESVSAVGGRLTVPVGSLLVVRTSGEADFEVSVSGGLDAAQDKPAQAPAGTEEQRFTIAGNGTATLRGLGREVVWLFRAIPDQPPTIALAKDPERQARGAFKLSYRLGDDYGVVEARAIIEPKTVDPAAAPRPLFDPPEFALALPQTRTKNGVGQTTKDLTENPWAGAEVAMTLVARDEAKNEGRSDPHTLRLPERIFVKPLARALIEQRRTLALDADARDRVAIALDALTIAPEHFAPAPGTYIGLRTIFWMLAHAKSDDDLREVVNQLWAMATQLEDGDVSDAEAQLRAAQERLRQALERGASEEEIKRLMAELRAALDKFLQALAEELRKNPQLARPIDPDARQLRSQDLRSMLDRLEQLARSGAKDAARALLEQLQSMLENLQMARPGMQGDGSEDDMMSALDELGDMIHRQQRLRDRTFQEGQDQRAEQGQGQPGMEGDQSGLSELQQNQQALRDQLKQLMEQFRQHGLGQQPGSGPGDGRNPLGRADEAMGDAVDSLGQGDSEGAVDNQGRVLDALRRGAQSLAQQLRQRMGQGPGAGRPGRFRGRAQRETDPLGRELRGRSALDDSSVKVPGEIDVQRARRILEELRRRLGDPLRPQLELDYIERLLRDY